MDLFEKVEGTLNARGTGVSCGGCSHINLDVITCNVSTLNVGDESSSKPKAPILVYTWELEISLVMTRGGAH